MNSAVTYPGTVHHQALLHALVLHYGDDPRVLALCVFGSLGRGNWDEYSDLDLDIVIPDSLQLDVLQELRGLAPPFTAIGEAIALIEPDGPAAGDIVLESLRGLSIRYHPLKTTSPNIVDSLLVLAGPLDAQTIKAAGLANCRITPEPLAQSLGLYIRLAIGVDSALHRHQFWRALEHIQRMRGLLLDLFARTRGGSRPFHVFQAEAERALQMRLGATLPHYSLPAAQAALGSLLDLVETDLGVLTNGQFDLTSAQRRIIEQVRRRQLTLQFVEGAR